MAANDLTAARLRELLHYDWTTGAFIWRIRRGPNLPGAPAGAWQRIGYLVIRLDGALYYGHRLAFLYVTGVWPQNTVDHIDGDKGNNRWSNLRDVPHVTNCANQHKAQGSAGLLGAVRNRRTKNWRAIITRGDKQVHLGTFPTAQDAHEAYLAERRKAGGI